METRAANIPARIWFASTDTSSQRPGVVRVRRESRGLVADGGYGTLVG